MDLGPKARPFYGLCSWYYALLPSYIIINISFSNNSILATVEFFSTDLWQIHNHY